MGSKSNRQEDVLCPVHAENDIGNGLYKKFQRCTTLKDEMSDTKTYNRKSMPTTSKDEMTTESTRTPNTKSTNTVGEEDEPGKTKVVRRNYPKTTSEKISATKFSTLQYKHGQNLLTSTEEYYSLKQISEPEVVEPIIGDVNVEEENK